MENTDWEILAKVIANEAFGYNGSDKTNPPMTGLKWAGATLKETVEVALIHQRQEILDQITRQLELTVLFNEKRCFDGDIVDWPDSIRAFIRHELSALRLEGKDKA